MSEEQKPDKQEIIRDDKGRFKEGTSGNLQGRPKGLTIKEKIRQYYEEHPNEFEDLCKFYMTDTKMRDLLWKMLDGLPKQSLDLGNQEGEVFTINIIKPE